MADPVLRYATRDDLETWGLSARALEGFDPDVITKELDAASRLVDSYISGKYALPLQTVGADLGKATAVIAAYELLSNVGYNPATPGADENFRLRYVDKIAWLKDLRDGKAVSTGTTGSGGEPVDTATTMARPIVISSSQRGYSSRGNGYRGGFVGD
jgi:phage gp36-like protein